MFSFINNFNHDFRELNFFEAVKLKKTPIESSGNLAHSISTLKLDSYNTAYQVTHLNMTVDAYLQAHKKMSFLRKLFNIFATYKAKTLKKHLPNLINAIANTCLDDLKQEGEVIQEKITLLGRVQLELAKEGLSSKTAKQVNAYFQHKMTCLQQGFNVALPFPGYYHSTQEIHFDKIIHSKEIKQTHAGCGFGAYISTNIECNGYGPYAFAVDGEVVESFYASYFIGNTDHDPRPHDSLWISVAHNIPVNWKATAHITVENFSKLSSMVGRIKVQGLHVPVLTREASYKIDDLFRNVIERHKLPPQWRNKYPHHRAPNFLQEYCAA